MDEAILTVTVYGIVFYVGWCCGRGWKRFRFQWPVVHREGQEDQQ